MTWKINANESNVRLESNLTGVEAVDLQARLAEMDTKETKSVSDSSFATQKKNVIGIFFTQLSI